MVSYQKTENLSASAEITYSNMRSYYEHYAVDWECSKIDEQISVLFNFDILFNGEIAGAIRLEHQDNGCYIRDLQVSQQYQNKGIGAQALTECERLALEFGFNHLKLRVFKISAAFHLYERVGFFVDFDDDRFYYMSKAIS
ncbi:GNAT family N-acetyltransferase [Enterovibrio calviensis]|uniref:GNAT family N-acetyltransferase n=1 Tax=Enterovibrio calviensis TaxID=91359 RepID=UPI00047F766F|nr:GNAT family N-acetyltransferase [Enterovibrio calviensis]